MAVVRFSPRPFLESESPCANTLSGRTPRGFGPPPHIDDGVADIVTASGERVTAFTGGNLPPMGAKPPVIRSFDPDPANRGGVWVG